MEAELTAIVADRHGVVCDSPASQWLGRSLPGQVDAGARIDTAMYFWST
jgi:hypothetical protein